MPINYDRINQNGWRQGSVFTVADSVASLAQSTWRPSPGNIVLPAATRLIVASHSCDVVSPQTQETHVEICPALPLTPGTGRDQFGYARNPRRLRIPLRIGDTEVMHDLHAPLRFSVGRERLEVIAPDETVIMDELDLDDFIYWLASRVHRRTLPDTFDRRLGGEAHKQIRKALSGDAGAHVEALLYSLSSFEELDDARPYRIRLVLLAKPRSFQSPELLALLTWTRDRIAQILDNKAGIITESFALETSSRMTVAQYQTFDSWGFEDLSLELDTDPPP
jgi:hypothetical protein